MRTSMTDTENAVQADRSAYCFFCHSDERRGLPFPVILSVSEGPLAGATFRKLANAPLIEWNGLVPSPGVENPGLSHGSPLKGL